MFKYSKGINIILVLFVCVLLLIKIGEKIYESITYEGSIFRIIIVSIIGIFLLKYILAGFLKRHSEKEESENIQNNSSPPNN